MNTLPLHQSSNEIDAIVEMNNETMNVVFKATNISEKSLLRYPGGKTRGVEAIVKYFPKNLTEICSPFFGGGSIELFLASKGMKVYGYDIFKPLVEFWQCVIRFPNNLADSVHGYYPLPKEMFYKLQQVQTKFKTKLERATVYYVLNRSSFSGATLSGGMSPDHPRFTPSSIQRLRDFFNPNFTVEHLDFKKAIPLHKKTFLYLDPPYLIESALYGRNGNTHKDFDHEALCKMLKKRDNWIMSYNDCDAIRQMYKGYKIIIPFWKYGMSNNKSSREILMFSDDLNQAARINYPAITAL